MGNSTPPGYRSASRKQGDIVRILTQYSIRVKRYLKHGIFLYFFDIFPRMDVVNFIQFRVPGLDQVELFHHSCLFEMGYYGLKAFLSFRMRTCIVFQIITMIDDSCSSGGQWCKKM